MDITQHEQLVADSVFNALLVLAKTIREAKEEGLTIKQTGADMFGAPIMHVRKEQEIYKTPSSSSADDDEIPF